MPTTVAVELGPPKPETLSPPQKNKTKQINIDIYKHIKKYKYKHIYIYTYIYIKHQKRTNETTLNSQPEGTKHPQP